MIVRLAAPDELAEVRELWAITYRDCVPFSRAAYARWIARRTQRLIERSTVLVCEDCGVIQGWLVGEQGRNGAPVVHYAYVKTYARRIGIARKLLSALADAFSVDVNVSWRYTHRRAPYTWGLEKLGWKFAPKLAR